MSFTGGCFCGQVRYTASAPPANIRICHCRLCQRAVGAPFLARAVFLKDNIERAGETTRWASSARVDRLSCARCGTPVFAEPKDDPPRLSVALATLDEPNALAPECHIWVSSKLAWVSLDDDLPQFPERAP
jgi:hypothetical protein